MEHPTQSNGLADGTTRRLERYADPSRPPAPGVYVIAGVLVGAAVALLGILPGPRGAVLLPLIAAVGVGYDRWLLRCHGVPKLRDLPAVVRREQVALVQLAFVVGGLPLLLTQFVAEFSLPAGAATAGIALAILLGIGGPIVDRRARSTAAGLLGHQTSNRPDPGP